MSVKMKGFNVASSPLQYYTVYVKASGEDDDVNISVTGNYRDLRQKNFELLIQSIGLRAMPDAIDVPLMVGKLEDASLAAPAAPTLSGMGYVWNFGVESIDVFEKNEKGTIGPVGHLIDDLNGIILPTGVKLVTAGDDLNIEFIRYEKV